uniref:rhodoquinone biosynthesis methyltransferase RquA n=1 Tax=Pararhizobium sp. IMCC3301 TaxID=3067904 RepID=UPI002741CF95|nr:rhodoquinone biosynthesis methyltransferase RquA [Pararhizobium sp. IMCC3301]
MHDVKLPGAPDGEQALELPDHLVRYYWWAYLRPASIRIFDRDVIVSAILWGQYRRLCDLALEGILPGSRVLQMACVYGDLSSRLAQRLGCKGRLDIVDIAPIQVHHARTKLAAAPWARSFVGDAAEPGPDRYDSVLSFFLLHELPDAHKHRVVDAALAQLRPGGRAIFIDYARPAPLHPLKPVMAGVFALLEPFARTMWHTGIRSLATQSEHYESSNRDRFCRKGLQNRSRLDDAINKAPLIRSFFDSA